MKSPVSALLVFVPVVGIASLVGCASGTDVEDPAVGYLASTPIEAGTDEEQESVKLPAPSNPPSDETSDEDEDAGAGGGGGGGNNGPKPDAGAPDAGGGGNPPGGGVSCAAPKPCSSATSLGTVKGDTGADVKSAQGSTSQWFTVRVTENDSAVSALELWMTASLVSPPGTNFDLFVYVPGSDTLECSAVSEQSTSTGSSDTAAVRFGEGGLFSNGSDDSRTVTVEVRHVSGNCDPSKKWTLTIEGNK
jgi:hypothetical protein